jgi:D-threo-aldose 1-dehydrogenase
VVVGMGTPEEVADNAAQLRRPVPAELYEALKRRGLMHDDAPVAAPAAAITQT